MKVYDAFWGKEMDLEYSKLPRYGDLMTIEDFGENVEMGLFIDYDGHGNLATEDQVTNIVIIPSAMDEILEKYAHLGLTHVVWYNK
jgi:hypothetical protein